MGTTETGDSDEQFAAFAAEVGPQLRRAFVGVRGFDGAEDAVAEALAFAWEHWDEVQSMENPAGYLYRVGRSRTKPRRRVGLRLPDAAGIPDVEPALVPALLTLPLKQRTAVWLVHGCGWPYAEVADAMGTSTTMVGNHVSRALAKLRHALKVGRDG